VKLPTPTKRPKKQAVKLAIQQKQQVSGLFPSRPPTMAPPQMAPGALTVRNQLRGQKGRAR